MLKLPQDFWRRLWGEIKNLFPLFRYLILQTETHAFCLALACAALIGFFPSCIVMLSLLKGVLHWDLAYNVTLEMIQGYFLSANKDHEFIARNLVARVSSGFSKGPDLASIFWILLGAAGVFIPLESALNRLWQVHEDRPYWKNQLVGFTLTSICAGLGLVLVLVTTALHWFYAFVPRGGVYSVLDFVVIQTTSTCFFILAIFALYKFLPNKKIETSDALPASVLAGILGQIVRLMYFKLAPNLEPTQGPFAISATFLILVYIESFVVLGCAYLASHKDRYPWIEFIPGRAEQSTQDLPP